jgi:hypothetical protein
VKIIEASLDIMSLKMMDLAGGKGVLVSSSLEQGEDIYT